MHFPFAVLLATALLAPHLHLVAQAPQTAAPIPAGQPAPSLRIVDLHGNARERGRQHGEALAAEIAAMLPAFAADLTEMAGEPASTFLERFLAATQYEAAIRRHTPELLDELRGLAEGANQPFATMLAYQLADELWAQTPNLRREKCTSFGMAAQGSQPTIVGQNLDLPQWMHKHPTVLRIRHDDGLQELVVTMPGVLGALGMNSGKVAVCVNTILQLAPRRDGLPVTFVVRGLLAQPDTAAARAFLTRVEHASGQAYTIGGPSDVTCHEASAHKVVPFVPTSGPLRVWHTNHPVASDDWNPNFTAAAQKAGKEPAAVQFACTRFAAMTAGLSGKTPVGKDDCIALLKDPLQKVCNPMTYMCAVMTLGDHPSLQVTPGAPDRATAQVVEFAAAVK